MAVEWAGRGIRVSAEAPGTINTERVKAMAEEPGGPEYLETVKKGHPMGRLGEPEEVANAILFLASDEASFITGAFSPWMVDTWLGEMPLIESVSGSCRRACGHLSAATG